MGLAIRENFAFQTWLSLTTTSAACNTILTAQQPLTVRALILMGRGGGRGGSYYPKDLASEI